MKRCADCKQDLPDDQFTKSNPWYCRSCKNARYKAWYQRKREHERALKSPEQPKTHKVCKRCGETKPITDFYSIKGKWLHYVCKPCSSEVGQQRRALRDAKGERGYERLKFRCNRVGTTVDWYLAQEKKQGGVCALCGRPESHPHSKGSDQIRSLAVDHDHATGKVRGLLCFRCNTALYQLELNGTDWAHKAVAYLDEHKE
jgi:hypothetical protein